MFMMHLTNVIYILIYSTLLNLSKFHIWTVFTNSHGFLDLEGSTKNTYARRLGLVRTEQKQAREWWLKHRQFLANVSFEWHHVDHQREVILRNNISNFLL